tara:strand:- start:144896 stop:146509 length:1614 start_codon:yes stop_codon:yes gene_type:complete
MDLSGDLVFANDMARKAIGALDLRERAVIKKELAEVNSAKSVKNIEVTCDQKSPVSDQVERQTYELQFLPLGLDDLFFVLGRNIAFEKSFRRALTDSRQRYKDLVEICGDFCWETDDKGMFVFVSPSGALGYEAEQLVGSKAIDFIDQQSVGASPFSATSQVSDVDVWFRRADEKLACLLVSARPLLNADGRYQGARGVCRDVTAERENERELARVQIREKLIAHINQTIRDTVEPSSMLDTAVRIIAQSINAEGCQILRTDQDGGFHQAAWFGNTMPENLAISAALAQIQTDNRIFCGNHDGFAFLAVATSCQQETNGAIVLWRNSVDAEWAVEDRDLLVDVSVHMGIALQQIYYQLELETLSRTDPLTGLLNRRAFTGELENRVERAAETGSQGALIYIDLDNFKPVNDILGYQKGDEALVVVSKMLTEATRAGDLIARLGGDEFALWLDRTDESAATLRAQEMLQSSKCLKPYSGDPERPLGISLGIAIHSSVTGESVEELTTRADNAMYDVKHNGKAGYAVADQNLNHNRQAI